MESLRGFLQRGAAMVGTRSTVAPPAARQAGGFPAGKLMFRPQPYWQAIRPDHITPSGLEFRLSMESGGSTARLKTKVEIEPDSDFARGSAKVVKCEAAKGDGEFLSSVLRETAADADAAGLVRLLQSCFVTREAAEAAVCESAKLQTAECLGVLLGAGCPATAALSGKRALHFAVESSSEACAKLLIDNLEAREVHRRDARTKRSALEEARVADMLRLARTLAAYAAEQKKPEPEPVAEKKEEEGVVEAEGAAAAAAAATAAATTAGSEKPEQKS